MLAKNCFPAKTLAAMSGRRPLVTTLAALLFCTWSALGVAQTETTLVPTSYTTTSGTDGGQPVASSIDILDESGSTNTWAKYVEFQTAPSVNYAGYQVFTLPTGVSPSSITAMQVKVNYDGPLQSTQTWTWQIFNWSTASYANIGTNAGVRGWGAWTILTFNLSGTFADYVRTSDRQIRLQLLSNNTADNVDIDYQAVVVTSGAGVSLSLSPTTATARWCFGASAGSAGPDDHALFAGS